MSRRRSGPRLFFALSLGLFCCRPAPVFNGVDVSSGQSLSIEQRDVAREIPWSGVYISSQLGRLVLEQRANAVHGSYTNESCGCRVSGRLQGKVRGNLIEFEWVEVVAGCASSSPRRGRGFAFYRAPPELDRPASLFGHRDHAVEHDPQLGRSGTPALRDDGPWTAIRTPANEPAFDAAPHCP